MTQGYQIGPDGKIHEVRATPPPTSTGWNIFDAVRPPQDSVYRSREGTGYPSCSRALAKIPRNTNDANGYYRALGVDPWAPIEEIKRALRKKLATHHPDGPEPDLTKFMRFKEIHTVLTNPIHKANYDSIPPGRKLIDSEVMRDMEEAGITPESPGINPFDATPEDMGRDSKTGRTVTPTEKYWDYLATDHNEMDLINVQEWYAYLLDIAPMFRYDGTIKILLHDGKASALKKQGGIMLIPRSWEPSAALAFHMCIKHLGWPDTSKPLHPLDEPQSNVGFTVTRTSYTSGSHILSVYSPNVGGSM